MNKRFLDFYMGIAESCADMSYATRLKVGSVAVRDHKILASGWNGTPSGWDNACEDHNGVTHEFVLHSEENLLTKLARSTESSSGCSVFITHSPCINCAKLLYNSGVSEVYYKHQYRNDNGIKFLEKCGVKIEQLQ